MPTYEYKCQICGHSFEKFQSIKDKPLEKCPECNGKIQRLIGCGAGIIFKESGFYGTDYRSNNSPACGRERPCCGREIPCDKKPCE
jgi:putative FmdB family regulatory protein